MNILHHRHQYPAFGGIFFEGVWGNCIMRGRLFASFVVRHISDEERKFVIDKFGPRLRGMFGR